MAKEVQFARERLAEQICAEEGISTESDYRTVALNLLHLLYELDTHPGNRVLVLQQAIELEKQLGVRVIRP